MKLPIEPENLPPVDHAICEAVCIEHDKSTTRMAQTLRDVGGWSPMQAAYAEDHWSWSWIARAVVAVRVEKGLVPAPAALVGALLGDTPSGRLAVAEAAHEAVHGPTPPPRAPGGPIQLPRRPATLADASVYLPDVESQGEGQQPAL